MKHFFIYCLLVLLIVPFCILEIITYYPEKFKITHVETTLFKVKGPNRDRCYIVEIQKDLKSFQKGEKLLLAIRFGVEYISLSHESFWNKPHAPKGFLGHTDEITDIELKCSNKQINSALLLDASKYINFNVLEYDIMAHSGNGKFCYTGNSYLNVKSFINYYNSNKETGIISTFTNYHLFCIPDSLANNIDNECIKVCIRKKDMSVIQSNPADLKPQVILNGYWEEERLKSQELVKPLVL